MVKRVKEASVESEAAPDVTVQEPMAPPTIPDSEDPAVPEAPGPEPPTVPQAAVGLAQPGSALSKTAEGLAQPVKKKRVMSEAQLDNLRKAREAKAAKKGGGVAEVDTDATPQPPSLTKPPPAAPAKAKPPSDKAKPSPRQPAAPKAVDFVDAKIEKAKAITKKVMSQPIKKAPKQTSVDEKALKENQRRKREAEEREKLAFDAKVAAAVKREVMRQKQAEKYMEQPASSKPETASESEPVSNEVAYNPAPTAAPPFPSRSQRQVQYNTSEGPVYIQQSRHGDEFLDRLFAHAPGNIRHNKF